MPIAGGEWVAAEWDGGLDKFEQFLKIENWSLKKVLEFDKLCSYIMIKDVLYHNLRKNKSQTPVDSIFIRL